MQQNNASQLEEIIELFAQLPQPTQFVIAIAVGAIGVKVLEDRIDRLLRLKEQSKDAEQPAAPTGTATDMTQIAALVQLMQAMSTPQMHMRADEVERRTNEHAQQLKAIADAIAELQKQIKEQGQANEED